MNEFANPKSQKYGKSKSMEFISIESIVLIIKHLDGHFFEDITLIMYYFYMICACLQPLFVSWLGFEAVT